MRVLILAVAALSVAATPAFADSCKDAHGKLTNCPTATETPGLAAIIGGIITAKVIRDKNGQCHFASGAKKGEVTKCP